MNQKQKNFIISESIQWGGVEKAISHYKSHLIYLEEMQKQLKGFTSQIKTCKESIILLEKGLTARPLSVV